MARRLLFVAGGVAQLPGVLAARDLGYEVIVIDGSASAPAMALADESAVVDIGDPDAVLDFARSARIDGVTAVACEVAMPAVGRVVDELDLPGMGAEQTRVVTNKLFMRSAWRAAGLPGPAFWPCAHVDTARHAAAEIGLPIVIKPVDSSGSRGVRRVDRMVDVDDAFYDALSHSPSKAVLVEDFIQGVEVSFEAFADGTNIRPIAVSQKQRTPPPFLMDVAVDFPADQPSSLVAKIIDVGTRAAQALRVENAPIHMELMLTADGPVPVELAARGAGSGVYTKILPLLTGVDLVAHQIKLAMGDAPPLPRFVDVRRRPAVVLRFLYSDRDGALVGLHTDPAREVAGVVDVMPYKQTGDQVERPRNGTQRLGHIITTGANLGAARAIAEEAASHVRVEVA